MFTQDPSEKVLSVLEQLRALLDKPSRLSMSTAFRMHNLANDYGTMLVERGIVKKEKGGHRGPSSYQWNKEVSPSKQLAESLVAAYNKKRVSQIKTARVTSKEEGASMLATLVEIRDLLVEIRDNTKPIELESILQSETIID